MFGLVFDGLLPKIVKVNKVELEPTDEIELKLDRLKKGKERALSKLINKINEEINSKLDSGKSRASVFITSYSDDVVNKAKQHFSNLGYKIWLANSYSQDLLYISVENSYKYEITD